MALQHYHRNVSMTDHFQIPSLMNAKEHMKNSIRFATFDGLWIKQRILL
jgi:hypothetical protein